MSTHADGLTTLLTDWYRTERHNGDGGMACQRGQRRAAERGGGGS